MSDAYDPDSTPNGLADETGMDLEPAGVPTAPHPVGETFVDAEGQHRHVGPHKDGTSVALKDHGKKPWLDVQGHGDVAAAAHPQAGDSTGDNATTEETS